MFRKFLLQWREYCRASQLIQQRFYQLIHPWNQISHYNVQEEYHFNLFSFAEEIPFCPSLIIVIPIIFLPLISLPGGNLLPRFLVSNELTYLRK